mmetsp:Transcript_817/g.1374  ORF Transcript_817/g.1374 Transcript_817/m.1374 type:complete len:231 (+) Transcript_817:849-1541(+)
MHKPTKWSKYTRVDAVMQLKNNTVVIRLGSLTLVTRDVVNLTIEIKSHNITFRSSNLLFCHWVVRCDHKILIHTNNASEDRYKWDQTERPIDVLGVEYLVRVKALAEPRGSCDVHLIHTVHNIQAVMLLAEKRSEGFDDMRGSRTSIERSLLVDFEISVPPVRRHILWRHHLQSPSTNSSEVRLSGLTVCFGVRGNVGCNHTGEIRASREYTETILGICAVVTNRPASNG